MRHLRATTSSVLIVGFLCAPFFVFAQTTATTTAAQSSNFLQEFTAAKATTDTMTRDYMNSLPTPSSVNLKTLTDSIKIKVSPQDPGPSETVTVTLIGYLTDLNRATIAWSINGKVASSNVGQKVFTFQNGQSGKTTTIGVNITTANGERLQKDFSFTPMGVTILWEADTYIPPFYKGKALLSPEARVRVIAIPDTEGAKNSLTAGDFVYVWEKNGSAQTDVSGYQKNSFPFVAPLPFGKTAISVSVSSLNGSAHSKKKVDLPLSQPFILFYEKHPLLGVWYNRPFDTNITLSRKEFSMSAEPYFFSNETSETPALKYDWAVNGNATQNYGRTITLRNDTGGKGDSAISLAMRSIRQTFQSASQELLVHFTEDTASRPTF